MEHLGRYRWRKSSYSANGGTDCVEVGTLGEAGSVLVRDTRDRSGPVLRFAPAAGSRSSGQNRLSSRIRPAGRSTGPLA